VKTDVVGITQALNLDNTESFAVAESVRHSLKNFPFLDIEKITHTVKISDELISYTNMQIFLHIKCVDCGCGDISDLGLMKEGKSDSIWSKLQAIHGDDFTDSEIVFLLSFYRRYLDLTEVKCRDFVNSGSGMG
jgi:hypothetical protein